MSSDFFLKLIDERRNIYENAMLFDQKRLKVQDYIGDLRVPGGQEPLDIEGSFLQNQSKEIQFAIQNDVVDFTGEMDGGHANWASQNKKFLNYHRSLTMFTFMNSIAIDHYLGEQTGLHKIKDATVIDVGGGTGHSLCSFFRYPETIRYFLVDPNLRLMHDQFIRMYPQLLELPMAHLLAYGEHLPFRNDFADLVMSSSSIDHMADQQQFIKDSFRVLKKGGHLLITSHLDVPISAKAGSKISSQKWSIPAILETAARTIHRFSNKVAINDHTMEFEGTEEIQKMMEAAHFKIIGAEVFKRYFYVVGEK